MLKVLRFLLNALRKLRNVLKVFEFKLKGVRVDFSTIVEPSVCAYPGRGKIAIGQGCYIGHGVILRTFDGSIRIGNNCSIHPYCVIDGGGGVSIGDDVRIAPHTVIVASNHVFTDVDAPICQQGLTCKGIAIQNDVWIGAGVRILDGVVIERGCVIGAGSVVTKSAPKNSILAGVPARVIKNRGE